MIYFLIFSVFINLILLFLIVKTIQQFKGLDLMSARLLYPYLIWVGFASYLNLGIVLLNYGNK